MEPPTTGVKNAGAFYWQNERIVDIYANGGNLAQQGRIFDIQNWLARYPIQSGETIIDVGCGTAEITQWFGLFNGKGSVWGVDFSPAMIVRARETISRSGLSNVNVWKGDATALDLVQEEGTIDRFVSFTAAHWFPKTKPFIEGVERYLKPGGLFYFRYAGGEGDETLELAEKMRMEKAWKEHFASFDNPFQIHKPDAVRQQITESGMRCGSATIWENETRFPDPAMYRRYVEGWLPHLYHLQDDSLRAAFIEDLVERHCSRSDRRDGDIVTVMDTQVKIWGYKPAEATP